MDESGNADGIPGITVPRLCGGRAASFSGVDGKKNRRLQETPLCRVPAQGRFVVGRGAKKNRGKPETMSCHRLPLSVSPGDDEHRKAPASPGCYIDQNKARLGGAGGSLRGEGEPFVRQPKGSPSPSIRKKQKLSTKSLTSGGLRRSVRLRRLRRTANDAKASRN